MIGKSRALRTGFGIIVGLLVVATFTAYRIQESFSKRTVEIHRRYVQQQAILNQLSRILWTGGMVARDFFINAAADRTEVYMTQISTLRAETNTYFADLAKMGAPVDTVKRLKEKFEAMWSVRT